MQSDGNINHTIASLTTGIIYCYILSSIYSNSMIACLTLFHTSKIFVLFPGTVFMLMANSSQMWFHLLYALFIDIGIHLVHYTYC